MVFCYNVFGKYHKDVVNETYISKNDSNVRIELTDKTVEVTDYNEKYDVEILAYTYTVAYLHVGKKTYEGSYSMPAKGFRKELWVSFEDNGECHRIPEGSSWDKLDEYFYVKGNRLIWKEEASSTRESIFEDNDIFYRKTWWNTWWKKVLILLFVIFLIWLFRIPELIKSKKCREETINSFKDLRKEYREEMKETKEDSKREQEEYKKMMKEGVQEGMKEIKEGISQFKDDMKEIKENVKKYKEENKKDK